MKSIYWYENDQDLFRAEVAAMKKYFPTFKLMKLRDGRLYWRGSVNPVGDMNWDLMVIYDNNHPYTDNKDKYGGSIDVFPVSPKLYDLQQAVGKDISIPHVYWGNNYKDGYICTVRANEFKAGPTRSSSAASCLSWACKWIAVFELWVNGDIPFEEFDTKIHKF